MSKKGSLTLEQLKSLCNLEKDIYISKEGEDYINSLSSVFNLINRNDKPFSIDDIIKEPLLSDFEFEGKNDFIFICKLKADPMEIKNDKRRNEKILAIDFVNRDARNVFDNSLGVAYIITCTLDNREYIIKFGQSRTTFKKRLGSYNCGVVNNWRTASTTNIKMLQSMVSTRLIFNLYLFDCSTEPYVLSWHGEQSVKFASPKSLAVEDIMIKKFAKQFGKKPLANIQANATSIN